MKPGLFIKSFILLFAQFTVKVKFARNSTNFQRALILNFSSFKQVS